MLAIKDAVIDRYHVRVGAQYKAVSHILAALFERCDRQKFVTLVLVVLSLGMSGSSVTADTGDVQVTPAAGTLDPWRAGILDIHHINTGRGNATFVIFPDGTTMLIDAGALPDDWGKNYQPLILAPAFPNNSKRPGEWIADYVSQFSPAGARQIDYALITHFHGDHMGTVTSASPASSQGKWRLTGLTDVAERWQIGTIIDRGYPRYDFPSDMRKSVDSSLKNYLDFVDAAATGERTKVQSLAVGATDQIRPLYNASMYPRFRVRGIAANGAVWKGKRSKSVKTLKPDLIVGKDGKFNENPLSLVIKLSYGAFDYVTGGDLTGVSEPDQPSWFNMESKIASVIGPVDAMTLNHHGNRDATNVDYLRTLQPRVLVQQTWVSDHPGGEVAQRIASRKLWPGDRDIFATYIAPETAAAIGPVLTRNYVSMAGHIVIRVYNYGQQYEVVTLDDRSSERRIIARFGPYSAR
jgi:Metallo-beta-lactamase superfamily